MPGVRNGTGKGLKNIMRRRTACILAMILLLLCFAFAGAEEAPADEARAGDYAYILLEDGTVRITGYSGSAEELDIPAELEGRTVVSLGDQAFSGCESLRSVTIPDSIADIGSNPFCWCGKLAEIRVSPDHPSLAVTDGVLFRQADQRLICYPCAHTDPSCSIPWGTREIGRRAFFCCERLNAFAKFFSAVLRLVSE